ncbi:glycosyltransferase [Candidatus Margulisiibacteriota bacterium]
MKIAIVHDYLNQFGGAERVVEVLHEIFPDAPIYTSIYLPDEMPDSFRQMDIRTSFMQKLPFLKRHFKKYLLLYPRAFKNFDLHEYDVILSSSSAFAKGVRKGKNCCHICYCYTPMRFAWRYEDYVQQEKFNGLIKLILPAFISKLKAWDLNTNKDIDQLVAISNYIAKRIETVYNRKSKVIYPPVETHKFAIAGNVSDYFLIVSRLNPYKKLDIAIKAFNELGLPLKIIGDGPYRKNLERMANNNIEFLGRISDKELAGYYAGCRALIFPGEEDFGIAPVEAQAAGRPVIAYGAGGALETVIEGKTGVFFNEQNEGSLVDAVKRFKKLDFDSKSVRENALKFDREVFKEEIKAFVDATYRECRGK